MVKKEEEKNRSCLVIRNLGTAAFKCQYCQGVTEQLCEELPSSQHLTLLTCKVGPGLPGWSSG